MLLNSKMETKLYVVHEMNTSMMNFKFQIGLVLSFIFTVALYFIYNPHLKCLRKFEQFGVLVKFIFFKKATKIDKIFTVDLTLT